MHTRSTPTPALDRATFDSARYSAPLPDATVTGISPSRPLLDCHRSGGVPAAAQRGPQRVGPGLGIGCADPGAPEGFAAEVAAPHPEPARVVMQDVLMGETHGAHRLVRDGGDALGELGGLALGRRDREAAA